MRDLPGAVGERLVDDLARIWLVRHGPVLGMVGRCYGRTDVQPEPGYLQLAASIRRKLQSAAPGTHSWRIVSSPALRCRILADGLGLGEVVLDPDLQEMDFGRFEGCAWDEVSRADLDAWAKDPVNCGPPGGETLAQLARRATQAAARWSSASPIPVVFVTHGGIVRTLQTLARGAPLLASLSESVALGSVTCLAAEQLQVLAKNAPDRTE